MMPRIECRYHGIFKLDSFTFLEVNPLEKNTIPQDTHNNVEQFYKKGTEGNFCTGLYPEGVFYYYGLIGTRLET